MMEATPKRNELVNCSFCAKILDDDVFIMIVGQPGIFICDVCVGLCNEIVFLEIRKKIDFKQKQLEGKKELKGEE